VRRDESWSRARFAQQRAARLATADAERWPHIVPIVFVVVDNVIYSAVDGKPKSGHRLRRLDNITANPRVSALVDHYADDWSQLWWSRADGTARILDQHSDEATIAVTELTSRYDYYRNQPPPGPVLAIDVARWSGWSFQ
jgi:PPOX class probable F420-dependent enzyme